MKSLSTYFINESLLGDSYTVFTYEWDDFKKNINSNFSGSYEFGQSKDSTGMFYFMKPMKSDEHLIKFYPSTSKVYSNIPNSDFHKVVRGEMNRVKYKF